MIERTTHYKWLNIAEKLIDNPEDKDFFYKNLWINDELYDLLVSDDFSEIKEWIEKSPLKAINFFYLLIKFFYFWDYNWTQDWRLAHLKPLFEESIDRYYENFYTQLNKLFEEWNIYVFEAKYLFLLGEIYNDRGFLFYVMENNLKIFLEPALKLYKSYKEDNDESACKYWRDVIRDIYETLLKESSNTVEEYSNNNELIDSYEQNDFFTNFWDQMSKNWQLFYKSQKF